MTREQVLHLIRPVAIAALFLAARPVLSHADPIGWAQPGGPGTPVYLTYSYSNLLQSGFNTTLSASEIRAAMEAAFGLWARYAPLHLTEVPDAGPLPSEGEYPAGGAPHIRIGYQPTLPLGDVAHTHVPYGREGFTPSGLGGDIHLSNDPSVFDANRWGSADDALALDFFSVMVHEAGHALGLLHLLGVPSVMGGVLHIFPVAAESDLFPADIAAIQALYGRGRGGVHPLGRSPIPNPEPASMLLLAGGIGAVGVRRRWLG